MSKSDFITHIKKNNLARHFEVPDPESDEKWKNLVLIAFRYVKEINWSLIFKVFFLME